MQINFKFELDGLVTTVLGSKGIITMLGVEKSGNQYYVKQDNGNGQWWEEKQLSLTNHKSS